MGVAIINLKINYDVILLLFFSRKKLFENIN